MAKVKASHRITFRAGTWKDEPIILEPGVVNEVDASALDDDYIRYLIEKEELLIVPELPKAKEPAEGKKEKK